MEQLSSRPVYRNAWMTVREDTVRRQDGSTGIYGVVDKPDFALVLPRHEDGFWLVEQYRYDMYLATGLEQGRPDREATEPPE